MADNTLNGKHVPRNQVFHISIDNHDPQGGPNTFYDDDGRPKRTCILWTASAHIVTAAIGTGVLSLPWANAQLGWIAGPTSMLLFSLVAYYTSTLLAACYRFGDHVPERRNHTYMDVVRSNLGVRKFKICVLFHCLNLFGVAVGYTTTSSISMKAIQRSICRHNSGNRILCHMSSNVLSIVFGIIQIIVSQIYVIEQFSTILIVVVTCTYTSIGFALSVAKVAEAGNFDGSLTGISIDLVTKNQKMWRIFEALGYIAFAYSYSNVHFEIEGALKSPPLEAKTMTKASLIGIGVATLFYMLFGCFGYAAFGDLSPENLLTDFGFHNPYWLLDIANAAVVFHLVGAYQVYCRPLFEFIEKQAAERFPDTEFITKEIKVPILGYRPNNLNLFRLVWRTIFVIVITVVPMLLPFLNKAAGLFGALGFWPLTVYFPVEMHIVQKKIKTLSTEWIVLRLLCLAFLIISIAAAASSIAGVVVDLKSSKPFKTTIY